LNGSVHIANKRKWADCSLSERLDQTCMANKSQFIILYQLIQFTHSKLYKNYKKNDIHFTYLKFIFSTLCFTKTVSPKTLVHLKRKATSKRICFKLWSVERVKKTRRSRRGYILISQYLCKGLRCQQMNYLQKKKTLILIYSRHNLFAKFDSSVEESLYANKEVPRHLS